MSGPSTPEGGRAFGRRDGVVVAAFALVVALIALAYTTSVSGKALGFNDFYREAWPAYRALLHGHLHAFLQLAPSYVGSLVLRAPFALIPGIWSGGARAVYFASAVPCMVGLVALCVWLAAQPRRNGGFSVASRISPVVYCVINPLVLTALLAGHPEDVLGGALCAGAVIVAVQGRTRWAATLLVLALINKSWALAALPVVVAVLPAHDRRRMLVAVTAVAAVLLPVVALSGTTTGLSIGHIFNPPQLLWWFGAHSWVARTARPIIIVAAFVSAGLWVVYRPRAESTSDPVAEALLLLSFVLLLRAALDPWNNIYYHVPFFLALTASQMRSGKMPVLPLAYSAVLMLVVPNSRIPPMSHDLRAAVYAAVVVPMLGWLASQLYSPRSHSYRTAYTTVDSEPRRSAADFGVPALER